MSGPVACFYNNERQNIMHPISHVCLLKQQIAGLVRGAAGSFLWAKAGPCLVSLDSWILFRTSDSSPNNVGQSVITNTR